MTPQQLQHLRDTGNGWVADEIEKLRKENAELKQQPDWSDSKTGLLECWKDPLASPQENLLRADGAVTFRGEVIANLRQQLAVIENTLDQERRNYKTAVKGFATACELHGAQLAEAQKQNEQAREIVELVAHIGVDFGYGPFVLDETHIAKARAIFPNETN